MTQKNSKIGRQIRAKSVDAVVRNQTIDHTIIFDIYKESCNLAEMLMKINGEAPSPMELYRETILDEHKANQRKTYLLHIEASQN